MRRRVHLRRLLVSMWIFIGTALACQLVSPSEIAQELPAPTLEAVELESITATLTARITILPSVVSATGFSKIPAATLTKVLTLTPTLSRTVTNTARPNPTPTRTATRTWTPVSTPTQIVLPASPSPMPTPSATSTPSVVKNIVLAQGVDLSTGAPVNPAIEFPRNSVVHAIVTLQNTPAQTKLQAIWYAVDVGGAFPANTPISNPIEWIVEASDSFVDFTQGPIAPVGTYRVEILVNGLLARSTNFHIK